MLNELKLMKSYTENTLKENDIVVVFQGMVYIFSYDDSMQKEYNIGMVIQLLQRLLCRFYKGMYDTIFDKNGKLRDVFSNNNFRNIYEALFNFENLPKILVGQIVYGKNGYTLVINNESYDIYDSKELYELLKIGIFKDKITKLQINGRLINLPNRKPKDIPLRKFLYHGTTSLFLESILHKGLRPIKDNSIYDVPTDGFVFLTSDYSIAEDYASDHSRMLGGQMVILEIDSDKIDHNKIVLDYDFENSFVDDNEISPYTGKPISDRNNEIGLHKGDVISMNGRYGTKFIKIGYKGIIMPNAIVNCIWRNGNKLIKQSREEILSNINSMKNEGINHNINEVSSSELNLNSFNVRNTLNEKFWLKRKDSDEYQLSSKVRLRLLDIADDFIKELSVSWIKPVDIQFTGSLANYNWSRYSDVDIHILYDFKKIYKKPDFVDDYFKAKKEVWLKNHKNLKIYGFPIEISVEDSNEKNPSSGKYSLEDNKWVVEPSDFQDAKLNARYIKDYSAKVMTEIDKIDRQIDKETDRHKIEVLGNKIEKIFNRLKNLRAEGLKSNQKEMSSGNIIYKLIRRMKYIDKIWNIANKAYDKVNSINENKRNI
mgnify:FL=1